MFENIQEKKIVRALTSGLVFLLVTGYFFTPILDLINKPVIKLAQAATANIVPNGDVSAAWSVTGATTHWDAINEGSTPSTAEYISATANKNDTFDMTTISQVQSATQVQVYLYCYTNDNRGTINVNLNIGGVNQAVQTVVPSLAYAWSSVTFSGLNISQANLDNIRVLVDSKKSGGAPTLYIASLYAVVTYTPQLPDLQQIHYRWRNDDGNESTATWAVNEDTQLSSLNINTIKRLRLEISNEGAGNAPATTYRLEVSGQNPSSCGAASYTRVSASPDWQMADSANLTDGNTTTNVSSGLTDENTTFVAGYVKDTGDETAGVSLTTTQFTELEYSLKSVTPVSSVTSYCFRVTNAGATTNFTFTRYAQVSIAITPPDLQQIHYRWRNDDGNESTATWAVNEDIKYTNMATSTIKRLRMEVSNEGLGTSGAVNYRLEVSGPNPVVCASASYTRVSLSSDWQMADTANYVNGTASTNITGGLTNENTTFIAGELLDSSDQVSTGIALTPTQFTEIEFSLKAITMATTGPSYCFRLTNASATTNFTYTRYAEVSLAPFVAGSLNVYAPASANFSAVTFGFSGETSAGNPLGDINITDNRGGSSGWSVDLTGVDWSNGVASLDYDGNGTSTGQLTIDMDSASLVVNSGSATGVSLGISDSFDAGTPSINLISATSGNGVGDYDITGILLDQYIPPAQATGTYSMILTFTAS